MLEEEEVERHIALGHIPCRNWCPVCVRSRGRERGHTTSTRDRTIPEYCFDYYFPGDDLGYKWTLLVGKERLSGTFMATALPGKGSRGLFGRDKILEFINENGDSARDIILKGDQENSLGFLMREVIEESKNVQREEQCWRSHLWTAKEAMD